MDVEISTFTFGISRGGDGPHPVEDLSFSFSLVFVLFMISRGGDGPHPVEIVPLFLTLSPASTRSRYNQALTQHNTNTKRHNKY